MFRLTWWLGTAGGVSVAWAVTTDRARSRGQSQLVAEMHGVTVTWNLCESLPKTAQGPRLPESEAGGSVGREEGGGEALFTGHRDQCPFSCTEEHPTLATIKSVPPH